MARDMMFDLQDIANDNGFTDKQRAEARALLPKVTRIFMEYEGLWQTLRTREDDGAQGGGQPPAQGGGAPDQSDGWTTLPDGTRFRVVQ
jgi:hypothetical protein